MIHLVTGGARAGKSRLALDQVQAHAPNGPIVFVATATAGDAEMAERIRRHQAERGPRFRTVEAPLAPEAALDSPDASAFLMDCLTLWTSNLLFHPESSDPFVAARVAAFCARIAAEPRPVVIVTNEVGLGIIPGDALSRRYQDLLGRTNQAVAALAHRVDLVVAGLPIRVR